MAARVWHVCLPTLPERGKAGYIRLLFAGRLDPVKGIDFLLRTLDKMSSAYKFHLTVLGTGPDEQRRNRVLSHLVDDGSASFTGRFFHMSRCSLHFLLSLATAS